MNRPEILAPAGGVDHLVAAVRSGADAVYLGLKKFNARTNAVNFDDDTFRNAVKYCHARNVKVYVTMNTLVTDTEITDVLNDIKLIADCGADAVIIQDLAVAKLWREHCPSMKLHASTQMAIHNVAGAKTAVKLGFKRIVLARELSLEEIKAIADSVDAEIEVFVHGALCMSVSGTCLLSSMIGARSGNRGKCAQPCRLNFKCKNREYALSLKDLSAVSELDKLAEAGVTSFKIEGRMKRPEYVSAAVAAVKKSENSEEYNTETLQAVFSRSGFTNGYIDSKRDLDMYGFRRREDVTAAAPVLREIASSYKDEIRCVPVKMILNVDENSSSLTVTDGVFTVCANGETPVKAINRPLDSDYAGKCLRKTGGTIFTLGEDDIEYNLDSTVTMTAAQINQMRRNALTELYTKRHDDMTLPKKYIAADSDKISINAKPGKTAVRARFEKYEQVFTSQYLDKIILPAKQVLKNPVCIEKFGEKLICELPVLVFENNEEKFLENLKKLKELGVTEVSADNIGVLAMAKELGFTVHGGHGLNVLNSYAFSEYEKLGAADITVSPELQMQFIQKMGGTVKKGILGYGFMPLMRFRNCPAQTENGCKDCKGLNIVKDRYDTPFYIICSEKKYSSLLNSVPLYIGDKDYRGMDFVTLYYTFENPDTCKKVFAAFMGRKALNAKKTGGLYYRELL